MFFWFIIPLSLINPRSSHVNAIAPGFTDTPLIDNITSPSDEDESMRGAQAAIAAAHPFGGRLGKPEEIASAALFLASDDAAFVTGHVLAIDGGYLAQ